MCVRLNRTRMTGHNDGVIVGCCRRSVLDWTSHNNAIIFLVSSLAGHSIVAGRVRFFIKIMNCLQRYWVIRGMYKNAEGLEILLFSAVADDNC